VPKRSQLRRFRRGEKQMLEAKLHDRKLPQWVAQRYKLIGLIRSGLSVLAAARQVGCAKDTAYRCLTEFNRSGFRRFERSSNPTGRPSQLSALQLQRLIQVAKKRPTDVGLPFTNWSISKLHDYARKQRLWPSLGPEWLRQVLRREGISWQRTKTWKKSCDPEFKTKKSAFWLSTPSDPSAAWSSAMTNLAHWNSGPWRACAGPAVGTRNGTERPSRVSRARNNCMPSMMSMLTVWSAASANARRLAISPLASRNYAPATRSNCGSTSSWTTYRPTAARRLTTAPATIWKPSTCRPRPPGSTPSSPSSRPCTGRPLRIPMTATISFAGGASIVTCDGATGSIVRRMRILPDLCVRYLERH
jgi:transposase